MASLGVVLVVVCALGAYQYASRAAPTTGGYLAVYRPVDTGVRVTADDLQTVRITTAAGLTPVPAARLQAIVGQYATTRLEPGTLLVTADVTPARVIPPGDALAGLRLAADQRPGRALRPGDRVRLVAQPNPSGGSDLDLPADLTATVVDVTAPDSTGAEVVDVLVADADVTAVTTLAGLDRMAVVLTAEG